MDHMKEALKKKMGKVLTIHIQVGGHDKEQEKKSDLAPDVKDSDEPGVVKDDHPDQAQDVELIKQMMAQEEQGEGEEPPPEGADYAHALIAQSPDHPAGGKTLDSIAKERALKRMGQKKGLKG